MLTSQTPDTMHLIVALDAGQRALILLAVVGTVLGLIGAVWSILGGAILFIDWHKRVIGDRLAYFYAFLLFGGSVGLPASWVFSSPRIFFASLLCVILGLTMALLS
jgi:hypothetical protein